MLQVNIEANIRKVFGKGESRRLRSADITPAILYSNGEQALPLQFDSGLLYKNIFNIHGRNAVVTLAIEGDTVKNRHVITKEIQKDPVSDRIIHVDFLEISLDKVKNFAVPVNFIGKAKGVELGGDLQIFKTSIKLRGCPLDIPDEIEVDVTSLERGGEGVTFGQLNIPDNVELLEDKAALCVSVS